MLNTEFMLHLSSKELGQVHILIPENLLTVLVVVYIRKGMGCQWKQKEFSELSHFRVSEMLKATSLSFLICVHWQINFVKNFLVNFEQNIIWRNIHTEQYRQFMREILSIQIMLLPTSFVFTLFESVESRKVPSKAVFPICRNNGK